MRVSVNVLSRNGNATSTCSALAKGISRSGDTAIIRTERDNDMSGFNAAVLWGYVTPCQDIVKRCRTMGIPFVFIDLGYWKRDKDGYFKVTLNERHPHLYLMKHKMHDDRFKRLDLEIKPWRKPSDGHILIAGMSGKAAWSYKLGAQEYERDVAAQLSKLTKRRLVYRPKPNWVEAQKIANTSFDRTTPLDKALSGAHCVVTHHSNVGCDAIIAGVPVISKIGAASVLQPYDLGMIERLQCDGDRQQWANNVAYCQWTLKEMASGECWNHLKAIGLNQ